ncbi:MAG: hypothetical protein AB4911_19760 [Oscillochloridaceae bacterium umkhey_bin13]
MLPRLVSLALRAIQVALALMAGAYLWYFADRVRLLFAFRFPLDYGEGPLLAQVDQLLARVPIWQLYADPALPPFLIINYPPLYLLVTAALSPVTGSALIAGRLVALAATLASVVALARLTQPCATPRPLGWGARLLPYALASLFLTVPIVREWGTLMRVDMLGLALGLWGLVLLVGGQALRPGRAFGAGLLLTASLFVKPSLLAAPAAAVAWLAWTTLRSPEPTRRLWFQTLLALVASMALVGGGLLGLFQLASNGWFTLHVVAANANRWELDLALGFWEQQLALRWPLGLAAMIALGLLWAGRLGGRSTGTHAPTEQASTTAPTLLAALYTLFGIVAAAGIGKVGAYSNYFLELYAGLFWLIGLGLTQRVSQCIVPQPLPALGLYALLLGSLFYYPPLWDANRLRPAGLIEPSPPRLALGRYGLWVDAQREAEVLAALTRVNQAMAVEVRAAGPLIFTDLPGVAAASAVTSRLQAFEARQLLDQGLADEADLLYELANGTIPLAVIDYLGNWLTPGVTTILQRRYAHDGAYGTFDLYRPIALEPSQALDQQFATAPGLRLTGLRLAAPPGQTYEPGATLPLSLDWHYDGPPLPVPLNVVVGLATPEGYPLIFDERPLLYGVFEPSTWPAGGPVQHMHPLSLPSELPAGRYALFVTVIPVGAEPDLWAAPLVGSLELDEAGGQAFEVTNQFVPARLMRAWAELGGLERVGLPLTPAVPFAWGYLQCFERACLELRGAEATPRPLGERLYLAETIRGDQCKAGPPAPNGLCAGFASAPDQFAELGPPLSGELLRNGWIVQWSSGARLERQPNGELAGLGRLGDESLRLPPGMQYRWP